MPRNRDCITLRVYRISEIEPFFSIYGWPRDHRTPEYQRICADYWQCDVEDVTFDELGDGSEVVLVSGNIVGSLGNPVELKQLLAESVK